MSLTIFKLEKRAPGESPEKPAQESPEEHVESGFGLAAAVDFDETEFDGPRKMVLDLEHLTPETLEAFFPSETTLAK
jgi:hypothetical protein